MDDRNEDEQLSLFDFGGIDLAKLRLARASLGRGTRSDGTMEAYACDWGLFKRWCCETGRQSLPASTDSVILYVTWLTMQRGRKASTASRHVAAIAAYHRDARLPNPVTPEVRDVMTSVRRKRRECSVGKAALDPAQLVRAVRACDRKTNRGLRDRALLVLGFATSLRRSDLSRMQLSDVRFEKKGLSVWVPRSKNDQDGEGRFLGVWRGKRACTDPVRVLRAWLDRRGKWDGPLFCRIQTGDRITELPVTGDALNDVVKRAVTRAGLDPARFGAHSLRAGAVTASAEIGRSDDEIMGMSGHKNPSVMRGYIRRNRVFAGRNPLEGVL